mgnify:CR=1 FL=1
MWPFLLRIGMTDTTSASTTRTGAPSSAAVGAAGGRLALVVADTALFAQTDPDDPHGAVLETFHGWRQIVPSARTLVVAPFDRFLVDSEALRTGQAKGKFDALLLMPRGARDEEFHGAVTELLSDWGSTVADPEVEAVRLVGEGRARVWRLYLAGASVNFELGPTQVHQVLAMQIVQRGGHA